MVLWLYLEHWGILSTRMLKARDQLNNLFLRNQNSSSRFYLFIILVFKLIYSYFLILLFSFIFNLFISYHYFFLSSFLLFFHLFIFLSFLNFIFLSSYSFILSSFHPFIFSFFLPFILSSFHIFADPEHCFYSFVFIYHFIIYI